MQCHECGRLFATEERDKISIQRTHGHRTLWFHAECFRHIAGEEYVPARSSLYTNGDMMRNSVSVKDLGYNPWKDFVSNVPDSVITQSDLEQYARNLRRLPTPKDFQDCSNYSTFLEGDLKSRVTMGMGVSVSVFPTAHSQEVRAEISLRGTEVFRINAVI